MAGTMTPQMIRRTDVAAVATGPARGAEGGRNRMVGPDLVPTAS